MIFDVKIEDFRREARLVAVGHVMETPETLKHASVVLREMVRIALTLSALNDLQVEVSYIHNAYILALVKEEIWIFI